MRHLAGIVLTQSQFAELRDVCAVDPQFPLDWDLWQAFAEEANRIAERAGEPIPDVSIEPARFATWCNHVAVMPGLDALRAYAILARRRLLEKT